MKLSIITPIFKDSELAEDFVSALYSIDWGKYSLHEIIFIIDGSGKRDEDTLKRLSVKFSKIKIIVLSRNFGQHIALSAGYQNSSGDFICMINVDQQDSPYEIPKLLNYMKLNNLDIVYGLRNYRKDGFFRTLNSKLFNLILNKLTGDNAPLNVATLRIMNRQFINSYNQLTEKSRYIPGLESWLGYERGYLEINHSKRTKGKSSYNFSKRLKMAIESIVSFSDLPLRWAAIIGIIIGIIGFIFLLVVTIMKIYYVNFQHGYISTIATILFIGGIQIFVIGMASIYIGRILHEVQNRPLYIAKEKFNF